MVPNIGTSLVFSYQKEMVHHTGILAQIQSLVIPQNRSNPLIPRCTHSSGGLYLTHCKQKRKPYLLSISVAAHAPWWP